MIEEEESESGSSEESARENRRQMGFGKGGRYEMQPPKRGAGGRGYKEEKQEANG